MRWFVTGGCGFIGANLVRALTATGGHQIRVLDNLSTGALDTLGDAAPYVVKTSSALAAMKTGAACDVEFVEGDVVDGPLLLKAAAGADVIVHLAGSTDIGASLDEPGLDCAVNVFGTLSLLEAARRNRIPRFVFASDNKAPRAVSPHDASKLAGEAYCSAYRRSFGLETVILRLASIFGRGSTRSGSIVADLIWRLLAGEDTGVASTDCVEVDLVYVDDVVRAIGRAAMTPGASGAPLDISSGGTAAFAEIEEMICRALIAEGLAPPGLPHAEGRRNGRAYRRIDRQMAPNRLGWRPEADFDEALRRTVMWFSSASARNTRSAIGRNSSAA